MNRYFFFSPFFADRSQTWKRRSADPQHTIYFQVRVCFEEFYAHFFATYFILYFFASSQTTQGDLCRCQLHVYDLPKPRGKQ